MGIGNKNEVQYIIITDEDGDCASVSGGNFVVAPIKFSPKVESDIVPVALSFGVDTSLFLFTGEGKLDFIALAVSNSDYTVILEIDGSEVYRLDADAIGSSIGLTGSENETIYVTTANKQFRDIYPEGADFQTSFEILATKTSVGGPAPSVNGQLHKFREKI